MPRLSWMLLLLLVGGEAVASARAALDAFGRDLRTLSGRFEQRVLDADGRESERSAGTVAMAAPRQFRWDYTEPYAQQIIADGTHVWVYDVDLEQVTVRPQSFDEANSPLAVLLDLSQLEQEFRVEEAGRRGSSQILRLWPKSKQADFRYAELGLSAAGLDSMLIVDNFGQSTEIRFHDWQRNPRLDAGRFTFTPPPGVDVIGEQVESAVVTPLRD